jgi:hypothetical protein
MMLEQAADLIPLRTVPLAQFDPAETRGRVSVLSAAIDHAKRIRDWKALREAVRLQVEEQQSFVAWWKANVRGAGKFNSRRSGLIDAPTAERKTGVRHQQVSRWAERLKDVEAYRAALFGVAYRKAMADEPGLLIHQSLTNEYYTPAKYIDAARAVLGAIDLDPASCEEANRIVRAARFYDEKTDGLKQHWRGRVWLNPPYGGQAGVFVEKLCSAVADGSVTAAIALLSSHSTDTAWFRPLWDGCLCFVDGRINFGGSGPTHGSVFVYFGVSREAFADQFRQFGAVVARV